MRFTTFLLLLINTSLHAQFILHGVVAEKGTGKRLQGASVFLNNTTVGTVSDSEGVFTLQVPAGKYDLVASYVGYTTETRMTSGQDVTDISIEMMPKPKEMDDVVVGGFEKDGWLTWGTLFIRDFIGENDMSQRCSLKNKEVLKFRNNKREHRLTVIASEPLIIENKALGYTITYQLEQFEHDFANNYVTYLGYPFFTEMKGSKGQESRWAKNRKEAYTGSIMHFMRSVYRNTLKEEGFEVRRLRKDPNTEKKRIQAIYRQGEPKDSTRYYERILSQPDEISTYSSYAITGDSIAFAVDSVTAGLRFDNYLHIYFPDKETSGLYRAYSPRNDKAMSDIKLQSEQAVEIESSGNFYDPLNIVASGYWAWSEKLSTMLPYDYWP